jgi:hypothetical protein
MTLMTLHVRRDLNESATEYSNFIVGLNLLYLDVLRINIKCLSRAENLVY